MPRLVIRQNCHMAVLTVKRLIVNLFMFIMNDHTFVAYIYNEYSIAR